jgi:hypothetical protein
MTRTMFTHSSLQDANCRCIQASHKTAEFYSPLQQKADEGLAPKVTSPVHFSNSVQVKLPCYAMRAPRRRGYSTYSFLTSALDGVSGQRYAPAVLYPRGKEPRYPLVRMLDGPQSWFGHRG